MANLMGKLENEKSQTTTRLANRIITARVENWHEFLEIRLDDKGNWELAIGPKESSVGDILTSGTIKTEA